MAQIGPTTDIRELLEYLDATELDDLRSAFAAILLEHTDLEVEDIYSLVFSNGRKIIWS